MIEGRNRYGRTGEHWPEGLFIATGPGIAPGRLDRAVSLTDFVPTFARMLGLDPQDWDGQPILEVLGDPDDY